MLCRDMEDRVIGGDEFLDQALLFSKITKNEFQARRAEHISPPVSERLRSIDEISRTNGGVMLRFFDGTVVKGVSLGIEPDFDDDGEVFDVWVVGIKDDDVIVTLVPDYLADEVEIHCLENELP